ncbi:AbrB family transcriptional regulator [Magnetospirillum sp. ME-1]|uniref:AbrB family transcriptional regulator n=1 Tax=Magnetospirillum sp. ME-1 TaxID=1639348 RepID=UPI00202AA43A|nr:AbrB family transcriptional regulator [Magnetospirillum sp. ME-1]
MMRGRAWALALGLGALGGSLFSVLDLPLPWMLGALSATTLASLGGLRPEIPASLRGVMIAVLGLMLGSAFSPQLLGRIATWSDSLLVLLLAMAATGVLVTLYLRRAAGMSRVTAFFAAAPGGINEMVITGGALGGDERTIALSHSLRILLIVFTVPFGYRLIAHVHSVPMSIRCPWPRAWAALPIWGAWTPWSCWVRPWPAPSSPGWPACRPGC